MSKVCEQDVIAFLRAHPDFFTRHPALLKELELAQPPAGTASLVHRQLRVLREHNQALVNEQTTWLTQAQENEHIYRVFSACHQALLSSDDLAELANTLNQQACQHLALKACVIKTASDDVNALIKTRLSESATYLGRIPPEEQAVIFNESAPSVALYRLGGAKAPLGILAFSAHQAEHFSASDDNVFVHEFIKALELKLTEFL